MALSSSQADAGFAASWTATSGTTLSGRQLSACWFEYQKCVQLDHPKGSLRFARRVLHAANDLTSLGVEGIPKDPARGCPACCCGFCEEPGYVGLGMAGGLKPALQSVCADWCFKGHVLTSNKVDTRPPAFSDFVGNIQAEVMAEHAANTKYPETVCQDHCDVELTCGNVDAPRSKLYVYKAVLGIVCHHCIPLFDCFVFTPRGGTSSWPVTRIGSHAFPPEIYEPYRKFIKHLLEFYVLLTFMYDCACRFTMRGAAPPPGCSWPLFLLPWLHSRSHREKCQLLFSAMYRLNTGRRHGESTESLWSWCKAFWPLMEKMTSGHAIDFFQIMLLQLCSAKLENWPALIFTAWTIAVCKLGASAVLPCARSIVLY